MFSSDKNEARVVVMGGLDVSYSALDSVEIFDPDKEIWELGPQMPEPLYGASSNEFEGDLLIVGGKNSYGGTIYILGVGESRKIFRFSLKTGKWRQVGSHLLPVTFFDGISIMVSHDFCLKKK